jgi:hypothetical protein
MQSGNHGTEMLRSGIETLRYGLAMARHSVEGDGSRVESVPVIVQGIGMSAVGACEVVAKNALVVPVVIIGALGGNIVSRSLDEHDSGL